MGIENIYNTPLWKKKKKGELKEGSSKKSPLLVISAGISEYLTVVQPRPMPLDLDIGLPVIHM